MNAPRIRKRRRYGDDDEGRAADVEADGRVQRERRDERRRQADQPDRRRDPRPRPGQEGGRRSR